MLGATEHCGGYKVLQMLPLALVELWAMELHATICVAARTASVVARWTTAVLVVNPTSADVALRPHPHPHPHRARRHLPVMKASMVQVSMLAEPQAMELHAEDFDASLKGSVATRWISAYIRRLLYVAPSSCQPNID